MKNKQYLSTSELAELLGISRIAVFKKIKKGNIKAIKVGRNYIISQKEVSAILGSSLSDQNKAMLDQAVKRTVKDYGETLKLLGDS